MGIGQRQVCVQNHDPASEGCQAQRKIHANVRLAAAPSTSSNSDNLYRVHCVSPLLGNDSPGFRERIAWRHGPRADSLLLGQVLPACRNDPRVFFRLNGETSDADVGNFLLSGAALN
jgi:hypothetical protein